MRELLHHPESDSIFWGVYNDVHASQGVEPLRAGARLPSLGRGLSTVLPSMDFETYSEAGYYFDEERQKWRGIKKSPPHGLGAVGAAAYSFHPSTEVLSLAYDLLDGCGMQLWIPGCPPPQDLFDHIARGGLLAAWNSAFEWFIWTNVCAARMGWPGLPWWQLRDDMAKARAFALPGALAKAGEAIGAGEIKDKEGQRLLRKFSIPRTPTKKDKRRRIKPDEDPEDGGKLYQYNCQDVRAEVDIAAKVPDLTDTELRYWLHDQLINFRGVHIDAEGANNCAAIINQAHEKYTRELQDLTGGAVKTESELEKMKGWLAGRGLNVGSLDADAVAEHLAKFDKAEKASTLGVPAPPDVAAYQGREECRRVIELRQLLGMASIKKLFAIQNHLCPDDRLRGIYAYFGAHTGRVAGRGPQPANIPGGGPKVRQCDSVNGCGRHYDKAHTECPWCGTPDWASDVVEWSPEAAEDALQVAKAQSLEVMEWYFGNAVKTISGCLRALFMAAPGCEFISSDYSAIEAVVTAMLAGEQWRIDVFRTHGKIYEKSASKITGVSFKAMMEHAGYTDLDKPEWWTEPQTGEHHPLRKKIGKFAELASGFGGWIGAWKNFGADAYLSDSEIKDAIIKWREASPMIVELWGGQVRKVPGQWKFYHEYYGLEGMAVLAVLNPGRRYSYRGMSFFIEKGILYGELVSGRCLTYHSPKLHPVRDRFSGEQIYSLSYMGWNSDSTKGPVGWQRIYTYGGKLTENFVQATARDIFMDRMDAVERAGYGIVHHTYDEMVGEVKEGTGSIEHLEAIMSDMPDWCRDWPIKAQGGWRGKRYRKG